MRYRQSENVSEVIADVATLPAGLTRHDLEDGVPISFLYDGDESRPDSCQWRVIAPDSEQLNRVVGHVVQLLRARGIRCCVPELEGLICHFRDEGGWSALAMGE